ncbi:hypothetical protein JW977_02075 [Candidatus Falkowbacteria bacterium]|nr:hypothetical protein [Candidatus Falkowbacteria bacterium]
MSKFNKQNRLDEKAISIISDFFMNKHGDLFDLQFHGIKDNTPDTDGFLRLREKNENKVMAGDYLNQVVFFQLKGQEKAIENNTYVCKRQIVEFCKEINLPTILFVVSNIFTGVDNQKEIQIYWYHFSRVNIEVLNEINKSNNKNMILHGLEPLKVGNRDYVDIFYTFIKKLAKKDDFLDLPKELLDLAVNYKNKTLIVASILYLIGKVDKSDRIKVAKLLGFTLKDLNDIIISLSRQKLVYKNKDSVIFKQVQDEFKRDVGLLLLYEAVSKIDLDQLIKVFPEHNRKLHIYGNLSKAGHHPVVAKYFKKEVSSF